MLMQLLNWRWGRMSPEVFSKQCLGDGCFRVTYSVKEEIHAAADHPEKKSLQSKIRSQGDLRVPPYASEPKT